MHKANAFNVRVIQKWELRQIIFLMAATHEIVLGC